MCRNIRPLFNYDPPTTADDAYNAALQYVRKVSGYREPSRANREAFDAAVAEIAKATSTLLATLTTTAPPRDWEAERLAARERRLREQR